MTSLAINKNIEDAEHIDVSNKNDADNKSEETQYQENHRNNQNEEKLNRENHIKELLQGLEELQENS